MNFTLALLQVGLRHPRAVEALHRLWAYIALACTGVITEEATPIIGGLGAHDHYLHFSAVVLCVAAGTWAANLGFYFLGRWRGHWVRRRWPALRTWILRTIKVVRRHPWRTSVAVRWAYGLRLALPIACGVAHMPLTIYLIGTAISSLTWSLVFTALGWGFGRTVFLFLGHVRRYENYLVVLIVLGVAVVFWVMHKRHVEDEVVEVLASGDPQSLTTTANTAELETPKDHP